jgi:3-keto-5-aminohexanoate cleavage enzyme
MLSKYHAKLLQTGNQRFSRNDICKNAKQFADKQNKAAYLHKESDTRQRFYEQNCVLSGKKRIVQRLARVLLSIRQLPVFHPVFPPGSPRKMRKDVHLMAKTIITAALTGAVTPTGYKIPETPQQIAEDAYNCWKLGASIVHLHMRADDGLGCMDQEKFRETITLIRAHEDCDVIINCTSSGASKKHPATDEDRMAHHREVPGIEMGTFDAGTFNWGTMGLFENTGKFLTELASLYLEKGIKPECEIFDYGMLTNVDYFRKQGLLVDPIHYQMCMGVKGAMPATVENLEYLVRHLPSNCTWSGFGVGAGHMPLLFACLALGGHIRVGLEDNVVYGKADDGSKILATNEMLVQRAVDAVKVYGNKVATPAEAREMLGIPQLDMKQVRKDLGIA